jgi:choline dehydrogenase-like flavoprotein
MTELWTEARRAALGAFCDAVVPRLERDEDPGGFWARSATDLGVDRAIEDVIRQLPEEQRAGLLELLDALDSFGLARAPSQASREAILHSLSLTSSEIAAGVGALVGLTLSIFYGAPDPQTGRNPNWEQLGYPGPIITPPQAAKPIEPLVPEGEELTLGADVCVVGSGAGGGVVAGLLAKRGLKVVVLEAGGYFTESDFAQLELKAFEEMFWRGGPQPSADGNIVLMAGAALGGGTVINWTNCLRTPPWVRERWAREFGLEGVDGPEFDRLADAVLERIGATDRVSDLSPAQQRMKLGAERLGWRGRTVVRNADPEKYTPEAAGYMGFGDPSGSKRSNDKTWLLDAYEEGADILVRCRAQRILTEGGRAVGVEAVYADPGSGGRTAVTVRAPQVVVACGALESPPLLLRSGIGGPAAGDYHFNHAALAVAALYDEDQKPWWGPPHAWQCHEFEDSGDGVGFLIEGIQWGPAQSCSSLPWTSGREHKELVADFRHAAIAVGRAQTRGHGRITLDGSGEGAVHYSVGDPADVRDLRNALDALIRMQHAAGARAIYAIAEGLPRWRAGDDLDPFIAKLQRLPMRAGGHRLFSAHQMGGCRMGRDPQTSVANTWGELHDTKGVWIGDASAFPTTVGVNPMVPVMTLAHRTADAMAASIGAAGRSASERDAPLAT